MLIRHASHGHLGRVLSGRSAGLALTAAGEAEAAALARSLASHPPAAVQSSPLQRAQETASAIAGPHGLGMETVEDLNEIDFGDWTGRRFDELAGDAAWQRWNECRSRAAAPNGESMAAAQARAMNHLSGAAREFGGRTIAMVTHCDIVRAVVAAVLGLSLDRILQFDIDPARVSRIAAGEWGARLMSLNEGIA